MTKKFKAFIDKNPKVQNSALLAAFSIAKSCPEILKKLTNEITALLTAKHGNSHYHAINTLYEIKKTDQIAFVKILVNITKGNQNYNNLVIIQTLRLMAQVLDSDYIDTSVRKQLFNWISKQLNRSSNAVIMETAKVIVNMKNISNAELTSVVSCLHLFGYGNSVYVFTT
jgi:hypothetical protein